MNEFISLGLMVNRAATAMSTALNTALMEAGIDLPHSQFIVLRCLYYNGPMSQLNIARTLSKDAAAIKRTVDNLERKGLAKRVPVRAMKNSVEITDAGLALMPRALEIAREASGRATAGLSATAVERLMNYLETITQNLREE